MLAVCALAPLSHAQPFQIQAILQAGASQGAAAFGSVCLSTTGPNPAPPANCNYGYDSGSSNLSSFNFVNGQSSEFTLTYKNNGQIELDLYGAAGSGNTNNADQFTNLKTVKADPATIWTLPASAFFAQALLAGTSVAVSNLTLSGVPGDGSANNGAITVLSPSSSQTSLTMPTLTATGPSVAYAGGNYVFQGDSKGEWQLTGYITMTGLQASGGPTGSDLEFGVDFSQFTYTTPEPAAWMLMLLGLSVLLYSKWTGCGVARIMRSRNE